MDDERDRPLSSEDMVREFRKRVEEDHLDDVSDADQESDVALTPPPPPPPAPQVELPPPPLSDDMRPPPPLPTPSEQLPEDPYAWEPTAVPEAPTRRSFGGLRWLVGLAILGVVAFALFARGDTAITDLGPGDCFDRPEALEISDVKTFDCDEPHDFEVFAIVTHPPGSYPGSDGLFEWSDENCLAEFEDYVGLAFAESAIYMNYFIPSEDGWADGDREVICLLMEWTAATDIVPVEGSLRNSRR